MNYWLVKTEPSEFSITDLQQEKITRWDGIRNYQARNFIRDKMTVGDGVLVYHSSCSDVGIVGTAVVCSTPYTDPLQFDSSSRYFSEKSKPEKPLWVAIDIEFKSVFPKLISLKMIKADKRFEEMMLVKKGARLSVMPVSSEHWNMLLNEYS